MQHHRNLKTAIYIVVEYHTFHLVNQKERPLGRSWRRENNVAIGIPE
jgi:hypothetical protein